MAIFARRTIQRMLGETPDVLPVAKRLEYLKLLNGAQQQSLAAEWELALIWAFSKVSDVQYEKRSQGASRLDLAISTQGSSELTFIADITSVSDRGLEEGSPLGEIERRLSACCVADSTRTRW